MHKGKCRGNHFPRKKEKCWICMYCGHPTDALGRWISQRCKTNFIELNKAEKPSKPYKILIDKNDKNWYLNREIFKKLIYLNLSVNKKQEMEVAIQKVVDDGFYHLPYLGSPYLPAIGELKGSQFHAFIDKKYVEFR